MSLAPLDLCSALDRDLLEGLKHLAARSTGIEAELLVHLGEVDARGLALELGFRSLFAYCVEVLHFSESAAFHRITAARAARRFPQILERIRSGELHLSGLRLLSPQLTEETCSELLDLARHQSKRAIEERLANRAPKPDAPARVRRLPERATVPKPIDLDSPAPPAVQPIPAGNSVPAGARPSTEPLGGSRYKVQFTAAPGTHAKLREAQALLRHQIPDGDLDRIFDRALEALLREVRRVKFAERESPRSRREHVSGSTSRHIPAEIRRAVAARDGERCTFMAADGLRCRAHNALAAMQDFGAEHMGRFLRDRVSTVTRPGASREE